MIAFRVKVEREGGREGAGCDSLTSPFSLARLTLPLSGLEYRVTCGEHEGSGRREGRR